MDSRLKSLCIVCFCLFSIQLFGADRFWIGGTGSWNNTSNWSTSSGGAGGASIPTTSDDVFFDTLSFSAGGQTVTIDANSNCANMDWSLATNSPTFTGTSAFTLTIAGTACTFIDAMTYSFAGELSFTNTGGITVTAGDVAKTFGALTFTATSSRTVNVNGNGAHTFGRVTIGNNSTVNFNGTGAKSYGGLTTGSDNTTTFAGNVTMTDTLQTGTNNNLTVATGTTNSFQEIFLSNQTNSARTIRIQGTNTINGRVRTGSDVQNTGRNLFYNAIFQASVTIPQPNGRAQFWNNCVFNDTVLLEGNNSSARFYGTDTFNSVAFLYGWYYHFTESNIGGSATVFNDSVVIGQDIRIVASRDMIFNGPVNFEGGDTENQERRFSDNGGVTTFNDRVYFNDNVGTAGQRFRFDRLTTFNDEVVMGNGGYYYFGDNGGTVEFNDNLTMGNSNDIYNERNVNCDSIVIIGNNNTLYYQRTWNTRSQMTIGDGNNITGTNTVDFNILNVGDNNTINLTANIDFNNNAVFGDTNTIAFSANSGEVDVFDNLTFGIDNEITFNRRYDHGPGTAGDSLYIGRLSVAEFLTPTQNSTFEDIFLADESRITFRNGTNAIVNMTINDFSTVEFSANGTNTVSGTFTASEDCESPPIVRSGTGGSQATLDFTGSAQTWAGVILQDLTVTTTNLLTVDEGVDNGNLSVLDNTTASPGPPVVGTTIWLTNERPGTTLYWVGADGVASGDNNWSNRFNWSTSSGGNGLLNTCVPNSKDNVVFDANSFSAAGQQVVIDASFVICNDMTWSGITSGAQLVGNLSNTIFVVEDLTLDANMVNNFSGTFEFLADDNTTRTITPNGIDFNGPVVFNYYGGDWDMAGDLNVNGDLTISDGTLNLTSTNYDVTVLNGNDLIIANSGILNGQEDTIAVSDDVIMTDTAMVVLTDNCEFTIAGGLTMTDSADITMGGSGNFTVGGGVTMSNGSRLDLDTMTFSMGGNFTMNNDVVVIFDSLNGTINNNFLANNNTNVTLGNSVINVANDFYMQDNTVGSIAGGSITAGDDIFLDDNNQFTLSSCTLNITGDDFFMDDNTILSATDVFINVTGDDFEIENNVQFTINGGTIFTDDDFRIENSSVFTANGTTTINVDDVYDQNGGTYNANGTHVIDIGNDFDMDGGTFNANACNFFISHSWDIQTAATFNEGTSTATFDGGINNANIVTRGSNFYNLTVNKTDSTQDVRITNNSFIIRNNLTVTRGDFYDSDEGTNGPHQITGNTTATGVLTVGPHGSIHLGDNNGGSDAPSTFPTGWVTINLDDSSAINYRQRGLTQTVSSTPTYGDLFLNNTGNVLQEKVADGALNIEGILFIDDYASLADSGFQIVGNANAGTEFEMDANSVLVLGSATTATTLPSFPARDWDQRSTINYAAGVAQTIVSITGGGNTNSYGHITVSNTSPSASLVNKTMAGIIQIRRQLNIQSNANLIDAGFQITGNNSGDDLTMAANSQLTLGTPASNTFFPTSYTNGNISLDVNSLVVYNSEMDQDISDNPDYGNIQLSSTVGVVKSLTGTTDINGNLIIDSDNTLTTTASDYDITIAGDWTNNGIFSANAATVTFDGSSLSTIAGSVVTDFYDLVINNSASDSAVDLQQQANVSNQLTLTNGIISSDSTNILVIFDDATTSSGSNASHVDGPMMKVGNDAFEFPVGDGGKWARLGISDLQNGPTVTDTFIGEYSFSRHPEAFWDSVDYTGNYNDMHNTSIVEFWDLDRRAGTAEPKVTLYWSDNVASYITDTAELVVAHYTGSSTWSNIGGNASGALASGSVVSTANVTSFSPFTFGSTDGSVNPLPVEYLSFDAKAIVDMVMVRWTTLTEINNEYFSVQRSQDGASFEEIERVEGALNSNTQLDYAIFDLNPLNGVSYYRLMQKDINGLTHFTKPVAVSFDNSSAELMVYPNPISQGDEIRLNQIRSGVIFDIHGQLMMSISDTRFISSETLASGMYYLRTTKDEVVKFVVN